MARKKKQPEPPLSACEALRHVMQAHTDEVTAAAVSADGAVAVSGSYDSTVRVWGVTAGECRAVLHGHSGRVLGVAVSGDGRVAVSGSQDGTARVWDVGGGTCRVVLKGHAGGVLRVAVSADGGVVVSGGNDNSVRVWDATTGKCRKVLTGHTGDVYTVGMTADERVLSGGQDGTVRVWDPKTGKCLVVLAGHSGRVRGVGVSDDGRVAASGAEDGTVRVWDLGTGKCRAVLEGHTSAIRGVGVSADGAMAVSGGEDATLRVWDLTTASCRAVLDGHVGMVRGVGVSADGRVAVSGGGDRGVRVWDLSGLTSPPAPPPLYLTAKVVLVGNERVGKSGLAHRLAEGVFKLTDSTHGQQFWVLDQLKYTRPDGTRCEAILWDLAGQKNYRLTHALFLDDADLAVVLLNSVNESEPFKGVDYWLNKLTLSTNRDGRKCQVVLVAPKCDVSEPRLGPHQLREFCTPFGIDCHLVKTSAKDNIGIDDLLRRVRELLPWGEMVPTSTTDTFHRIKEFVLGLKKDDTRSGVLVDWPGLRRLLEQGAAGATFTDAEMTAAVGHLQRHGYVRVLRAGDGGERVLLKPEVLNNLAASIVLKAAENETGFGALDESRARRNEYAFPELNGLPADEADVLFDEACTLFVRKNLAFREKHGGTTLLILPELINQKKPLLADDRVEEGASYTVTGAVENVYAALVVLLGYTNVLERTHLWQDRAEYEMGVNQMCGFRKAGDFDGELQLVLFFQKQMTPHNRELFQSLFNGFLFRREHVAVEQFDRVSCGRCQYPQSRDEVIKRTKADKGFIICSECGEKMPLKKAGQGVVQPAAVAAVAARGQADAADRTRFETALSQLAGMLRGRGRYAFPTCFVSYAWGNKEHERWVERMARDLQKAEVDVILDKWHNAEVGAAIDRFVDRIETADSVVVVGTPAYRTKYDNKDKYTGTVVAAEMDLINGRMRGTEVKKLTVRPILLLGTPDEAFPPSVAKRHRADCRNPADYFLQLFKVILSIHGLPFDDPAVEKMLIELDGDDGAGER